MTETDGIRVELAGQLNAFKLLDHEFKFFCNMADTGIKIDFGVALKVLSNDRDVMSLEEKACVYCIVVSTNLGTHSVMYVGETGELRTRFANYGIFDLARIDKNHQQIARLGMASSSQAARMNKRIVESIQAGNNVSLWITPASKVLNNFMPCASRLERKIFMMYGPQLSWNTNLFGNLCTCAICTIVQIEDVISDENADKVVSLQNIQLILKTNQRKLPRRSLGDVQPPGQISHEEGRPI